MACVFAAFPPAFYPLNRLCVCMCVLMYVGISSLYTMTFPRMRSHLLSLLTPPPPQARLSCCYCCCFAPLSSGFLLLSFFISCFILIYFCFLCLALHRRTHTHRVLLSLTDFWLCFHNLIHHVSLFSCLSFHCVLAYPLVSVTEAAIYYRQITRC
jgi:hypothetical protein